MRAWLFGCLADVCAHCHRPRPLQLKQLGNSLADAQKQLLQAQRSEQQLKQQLEKATQVWAHTGRRVLLPLLLPCPPLQPLAPWIPHALHSSTCQHTSPQQGIPLPHHPHPPQELRAKVASEKELQRQVSALGKGAAEAKDRGERAASAAKKQAAEQADVQVGGRWDCRAGVQPLGLRLSGAGHTQVARRAHTLDPTSTTRIPPPISTCPHANPPRRPS